MYHLNVVAVYWGCDCLYNMAKYSFSSSLEYIGSTKDSDLVIKSIIGVEVVNIDHNTQRKNMIGRIIFEEHKTISK